jgi:hypothetical protein
MKTHKDQIWISEPRERAVVEQLYNTITNQGFESFDQNQNQNYGFPCLYVRGDLKISCRIVDSVFFPEPDPDTDTIITDNIPLQSIDSNLINVLPEFWGIWQFDPVYENRPASTGFNCFMNCIRGDRSRTFYELVRRNILNKGLVSFNCTQAEYVYQYEQAELYDYWQEHDQGLSLVPYNTVETHGELEQCIIDSNVSLILETYVSDSHIVFSEKIFRALQLPRPWLLYCSPGSVLCLKQYGFDVLADYVDHSYDEITEHNSRHLIILNQLETFIDKVYTEHDYARFDRAAAHNQQLLKHFAAKWPEKFNAVLEKIKQL